MIQLGNIAAGQTIHFLFSTNNGSGASIAPTIPGAVKVYRDGSTPGATDGVTYNVSFDGVVGQNHVAIDAAANGAFYADGHDYSVVLTGATIDGETVNAVLALFSIAHRYPAPDVNADAMFDHVDAIETGATLRQTLRIVAAVLAGKVSGAGSGLESFTGLDGLSPRVQVTADQSGNRTDVSYTPD